MVDTDDDNSSDSTVSEWSINEEWIEMVLRAHHKEITINIAVNIEDFVVTPGCTASECVLSDILAVTVKYRLRNEPHIQNLSFVIKLLPQDPFSRYFVTQAQFDLREIKFYTQIVPDLESFGQKVLENDTTAEPNSLPVPKCFYAHYSPAQTEPEPSPPESVLVLENAKPHGYLSADFRGGLSLRQALAAMESIAQFHALALAFKVSENKHLSERYPFLFKAPQASHSYQQLVERGLPQLLKFLESKTEMGEILSALNNIRPYTKEMMENLLAPQEPMALITHTDFWCNNLMFRENEESCECLILDWQMVTYSRPTNDLALLIVSSLAADVRRQHTDQLLDSYWEHLTANCRKLKFNVEEEMNYNRVRLGEDFTKSQLLALLLCIGSVDLAIGNAQVEERLLTFLQDLHKDGLLSPEVTQT
ncbi:uncharacterized protein LOC132700567 [Cylas formicarius]|uniref:uncharacterized protein LOC132700567 n=1 Tax=Cylas formicarius TaxID=197179 RepID=UPI002958B48A|nr:uncharacterized protein LOC132700567 [Cylas formicarius]